MFPLIFSAVEKQAIDSVKKVLVSPLLLQPLQPDPPITLTCDASQHVVAATLEQNEKPVMAAASKVLSAAEQKYSRIQSKSRKSFFCIKDCSYNRSQVFMYIVNKAKAINTAAQLQR